MAADQKYTLYSKPEYLQILISRFQACKAGDRILLMSMELDADEPAIIEVLRSLEQAAQRGAVVHLGIDARSFMDGNGKPDPAWYRTSRLGPLWFHTELPANLRAPYKSKQEALARLQVYRNAHVTITNKPTRRFSLTVAGRSHIKIAIINDFVITGSCNLDHPEYIELMVGWRSQKHADELYDVLSNGLGVGSIRSALGGSDQTIKIDDHSQLFIDAGVPGQSLIFEQALQLIDRAEDWLTITCQFFPNSITAKHLRTARGRGVKLKILYAHPWTHGPIDGSIQMISQAIERSRLPADMFQHGLSRQDPKVHAKLIASDAGVMIGSHNYVRAGVAFGTAEICLLSTQSGLAEQAITAVRGQISQRKV